MKKSLLALFFAQVTCFAQAPAIEWQKCLGGTAAEEGNAIELTADGGFIIGGNFVSPPAEGESVGIHDFLIVKTDSQGEIEWQATYGGPSSDIMMDICQTADGGYIVVGETLAEGDDVTGFHGLHDSWVLKLNATGGIEWAKCYGGGGFENAASVMQAADGGFIVAGHSDSVSDDTPVNFGIKDGWIMKLDALGAILWTKNYGGTHHDSINEIIGTTDGGFAFAGESDSFNGPTNIQGPKDAWIVKTSADGTVEWSKIIGMPDSRESFRCLGQTTDGGYIAAGSINATDASNVLIVKFDSQGNEQWRRIMGGSSIDYAYDVKETANGYLVACWTLSDDGDITGAHDGFDSWFIKLAFDGATQWTKIYGGSENDHLQSLEPLGDGSFISVGYTSSDDGDVTATGHGSKDIWLVQFAPETLSDTGFPQNHFSVYPNPAASLLQLHFPEQMQIDKITVTDILGKQLLEKTENFEMLNIENLSSGTYIIQAFSAEKNYRTKFIKQ